MPDKPEKVVDKQDESVCVDLGILQALAGSVRPGKGPEVAARLQPGRFVPTRSGVDLVEVSVSSRLVLAPQARCHRFEDLSWLVRHRSGSGSSRESRSTTLAIRSCDGLLAKVRD